MKATSLKLAALAAATLAATGVWADRTYTTAGTTEFISYESVGERVSVGSSETESNPFENDWQIWTSSEDEGVKTNGINQTSGGFHVAGTSGQTGRLKIESGQYSANTDSGTSWSVLLIGNGEKSKGYYWQTGGTFNTTYEHAVRIGRDKGYGSFQLDGGTFYAINWFLVGQGEASTGEVTVNGGELKIDDYLPIGIGDYAQGKFIINGGSVTANSEVFIAGADGNNPTIVAPTGTVIVTGGAFTNKSWMCLGRTKGAEYSSSLVLEDGEIYNDGNTTLGACIGENCQADLTVKGGRYITTMQVYIGQGWLKSDTGYGTFTVTVEGGEFDNSANTTVMALEANMTADSKSFLNLNGGTYITQGITYGSGTAPAVVTFDGGTLKASASQTLIASSEHLTVNVTEKGGIIDTNGKIVTIATSITGDGTLRITGGGTVTFTETPTCTIEKDEGTGVIYYGVTSGAMTLRTNDFLEYDLTSKTTVNESVTLAENVTITVPAGETVPEHVIIKNGNIGWNVSYEGNNLVAKAFSETGNQNATGDFTIWTGYYDANTPSDQIKSWPNGLPTETTKVIVPSGSKIKLYSNVVCGEIVLKGDFTLLDTNDNRWKYKSIRPRSVTGDGTLIVGFNETYGYLESQMDLYECNVNVPVIVTGSPIMSGDDSSPLNFNKSVTITGTLSINPDSRGYENVNFNDDVTVNGTLNLNSKVTELKRTLDGTGTINGTLTVSGTVSPGTDSDIGTLTVNGATTFNEGAKLLVKLGDKLALNGTVTGLSNLTIDVSDRTAMEEEYYDIITFETAISASTQLPQVAAEFVDSATGTYVWLPVLADENKAVRLQKCDRYIDGSEGGNTVKVKAKWIYNNYHINMSTSEGKTSAENKLNENNANGIALSVAYLIGGDDCEADSVASPVAITDCAASNGNLLLTVSSLTKNSGDLPDGCGLTSMTLTPSGIVSATTPDAGAWTDTSATKSENTFSVALPSDAGATYYRAKYDVSLTAAE